VEEYSVEAEELREKIRKILMDYGNLEYGDCIIDEICIVTGCCDV
jgi:hypothetical protein